MELESLCSNRDFTSYGLGWYWYTISNSDTSSIPLIHFGFLLRLSPDQCQATILNNTDTFMGSTSPGMNISNQASGKYNGM